MSRGAFRHYGAGRYSGFLLVGLGGTGQGTAKAGVDGSDLAGPGLGRVDLPGVAVVCATYERDSFPLGYRLGSQSLRIVDVHGRPDRVGDVLKHTGRSGLNCGSQTSKAREGSRPPWVQIPPLPPTSRQDTEWPTRQTQGIQLSVSVSVSFDGGVGTLLLKLLGPATCWRSSGLLPWAIALCVAELGFEMDSRRADASVRPQPWGPGRRASAPPLGRH